MAPVKFPKKAPSGSASPGFVPGMNWREVLPGHNSFHSKMLRGELHSRIRCQPPLHTSSPHLNESPFPLPQEIVCVPAEKVQKDFLISKLVVFLEEWGGGSGMRVVGTMHVG